MFIVIRHGGDELTLFNPDCSVVQLVKDIRKRCQCLSPEVGIALATDKLVLVHLSPEDSLENASSLFVSRTVYTLLAVYSKGEGEPPQYEAMLDQVDQDLAIKLDVLSNPNSIHQHSKAWNRINRKSTKSIIQQTGAPTSNSLVKAKKTGSKPKMTT